LIALLAKIALHSNIPLGSAGVPSVENNLVIKMKTWASCVSFWQETMVAWHRKPF